jgi:hypothetical protein
MSIWLQASWHLATLMLPKQFFTSQNACFLAGLLSYFPIDPLFTFRGHLCYSRSSKKKFGEETERVAPDVCGDEKPFLWQNRFSGNTVSLAKPFLWQNRFSGNTVSLAKPFLWKFLT